jgi:hypothetical protein
VLESLQRAGWALPRPFLYIRYINFLTIKIEQKANLKGTTGMARLRGSAR